MSSVFLYAPLPRKKVLSLDNPKCCPDKKKCACVPFLLPVEHPPWFNCPPNCPPYKKPLIRKFPTDTMLWYEKHRDYMHYPLEDRVKPGMAFSIYCDAVPDEPGTIRWPDDCHRSTTGWDRPKEPWPPLPQGACPPPRECERCGPGPWANPNLRRFFYYDCV